MKVWIIYLCFLLVGADIVRIELERNDICFANLPFQVSGKKEEERIHGRQIDEFEDFNKIPDCPHNRQTNKGDFLESNTSFMTK